MMDKDKENALIRWINVMVHDADLLSLKEAKDKSTILLEILKEIDPEIQFSYGDNCKNIEYVCQYVKELFNPDVVNEEIILRGDEIEMAKLLCFLLELTLTGSNNQESILKIQSLPEQVQTNIMSMTKMVCENSGKLNLSDIMKDMLSKNVSFELNEEQAFLAQSPVKSNAQTYFDSPQGKDFALLNSSSENTSPVAIFASSPQALYRRVMVENSKLKQKVRHSEMFLKRRSQYEEMAFDVESEKLEILKANKRLLKEQDQHLGKIGTLQETVSKLREEIEFLQMEVQAKDKEIAEQVSEKKKSQDMISQLQDTVDLCSEMEGKIQQKQVQYEEELGRTKTLTLQVNKVEQQNADLKSQLVHMKEQMDTLNLQMQKKKDDYADQLAHMEEDIIKLEKQRSQRTASQESLADTLVRDEEIRSLRDQNDNLQKTITVLRTSILNMGHETERIEKDNTNLQNTLTACKAELEKQKQRNEESIQSYKTQSKQYMDQISALLKQVEERSLRNEGLSEKINNADVKCKQLEFQIEKFEDKERKINEQIQQQALHLNEEREKLTKAHEELKAYKERHEQLNLRNKELETRLNVVNDEKSQLSSVGQQYQNLLVDIKISKQAEERLTSEVKEINGRLERERTILTKKDAKLSEMTEAYEKCQLTCQSTQSKYQELNERFEAVLSEKSQLQEKVLTSQSEKEALEETKQSEVSQAIALQDEYAKLLGEQKSLEEKYTQLYNAKRTDDEKLKWFEAESKETDEKAKVLIDQLKVLKESHEKVCEEKQKMQKLHDEVWNDKRTLQAEHDVLVAEKSKLHDKCKEVLCEKKELEKQLACLQSSLKTEEENGTKYADKLMQEQFKNKELENEIGELRANNEVLQKSECDLKSSSVKTEKLEDIEKMYVNLKKDHESLKRSSEESTRVNDVKYQIVLKENSRLEEMQKQSADERCKTTSTLASQSESYNSQIVTLENEKRLITEEKAKLFTERESLLKELNDINAEYEKEKKMLLNEKDKVCDENEHLLAEQKRLNKEYTKAVKNVTAAETRHAKKIRDLERKFEKERSQLSEEVNDAVMQLQEINTLYGKTSEELQEVKSVKEELSSEMASYNETLLKLEDKCLEEQASNRRLTSLNRSLETQLKSSENLIRNLKKELNELKSNNHDFSKRPSSNKGRLQATVETSDMSSDCDAGALNITDLHTNYGNKAEEIFQRSRSLRSRNSILALPTTQEETETSDNDDSYLVKTYSLRQKADRRRSFQPRRYMGGFTPPRRRTLIGEPSQIQMCNFSTEAEEEPDLMDDMDWGRIASLKEPSQENLSEEEQNRLAELQRRNTLCLPHLRSAYPMEVTVTKKNNASEDLVRDGQHGKRKLNNEDAPRGTFKKWKTDNALRSSSDLSYMKRSTRSDSNISAVSKNSPQVKLNKISVPEKPAPQSVAFEITMEPAKNTRSKLTRSKGSGNLGDQKDVSSGRTAKSAPPPPPEKAAGSKFTRNDSKRSSISRATQKVAASLRGRKNKK